MWSLLIFFLYLFFSDFFIVHDFSFLFLFISYLFFLSNSFLGCIAESTTGSEGIVLEHVVFYF